MLVSMLGSPDFVKPSCKYTTQRGSAWGAPSRSWLPGVDMESHIAHIRGLPKIRGTFSWGPYNSDHSILGSILGSPDFGKQPFGVHKTV